MIHCILSVKWTVVAEGGRTKPVYRLTTERGRSIKTTANHPYLTRNGWLKVSGLRDGNDIGVPKSKPR